MYTIHSNIAVLFLLKKSHRTGRKVRIVFFLAYPLILPDRINVCFCFCTFFFFQALRIQLKFRTLRFFDARNSSIQPSRLWGNIRSNKPGHYLSHVLEFLWVSKYSTEISYLAVFRCEKMYDIR